MYNILLDQNLAKSLSYQMHRYQLHSHQQLGWQAENHTLHPLHATILETGYFKL